jgi:hypothetical protein
VSGAALVPANTLGTGGGILRESLIIAGWVVMWHPLEVLLYGLWPVIRERRLLERLAAADVRFGNGFGLTLRFVQVVHHDDGKGRQRTNNQDVPKLRHVRLVSTFASSNARRSGSLNRSVSTVSSAATISMATSPRSVSSRRMPPVTD